MEKNMEPHGFTPVVPENPPPLHGGEVRLQDGSTTSAEALAARIHQKGLHPWFSARRRRNIILLLLFLWLGLILRLNNLSGRSLWTDEFFTLFEATGHGQMQTFLDRMSERALPQIFKAADFKKMLRNDPLKGIGDVNNGLIKEDTHPPFYFWLMHYWMRLFGDNAFTVRFFSVLMGLLSILLAYLFTRRLFGENSALFSAAFVSVSAFSVRLSQEGRSYALIMALGMLSSLFLLRFEKKPKNADILAFAVLNCIGLYTHYFYAFIALGEFIYFTTQHKKDPSMLDKFYAAFVVSSAMLIFWVKLIIFKGGYNFVLTQWIFGFPGFMEKLYYLFISVSRYFLFFEEQIPAWRIFLLAALLASFFMSIRIFKEIIARYPKQFLFCLSIFLTPLLSMFFLDVFEQGILLKQERFLSFSFIGFVPLTGYFLNYVFSRRRLIAYLLILLILAFSLSISRAQFGPEPKVTALWINRESKGKVSAVIVANIRSVIAAQSYYLDDNIYLIPVSSPRQLISGVAALAGQADRIFIVRHFLRHDPALMDRKFLGIIQIGSGFKLKKALSSGFLRTTEFESSRCGL